MSERRKKIDVKTDKNSLVENTTARKLCNVLDAKDHVVSEIWEITQRRALRVRVAPKTSEVNVIRGFVGSK